MHIARTPTAVHDAFREGYLTLVQAAKIDGLRADDQQTVAAQISEFIAAIRPADTAGDNSNSSHLRRELRRLAESRVGEQHASERTHVSTFRRLTETICRPLPGTHNVIAQTNPEVIRGYPPDLRAMRTALDSLVRRAGRSRRTR